MLCVPHDNTRRHLSGFFFFVAGGGDGSWGWGLGVWWVWGVGGGGRGREGHPALLLVQEYTPFPHPSPVSLCDHSNPFLSACSPRLGDAASLHHASALRCQWRGSGVSLAGAATSIIFVKHFCRDKNILSR